MPTRTHLSQPTRSDAVPDPRSRYSPGYALTGAQRAMVLRAASAPHSGSYVQQLVFAAPVPLTVDDWQAAWNEVVKRHEILRSQVQWDPFGEPRLLFGPPTAAPMVLLRIRDADQQSPELAEFLSRDRQRGFDWPKSLLWRVTYLIDEKGRWLGVWTFSHALLDGRSHRRVLEELTSIYRQRSGEALVSDLEPIAPPFHTFLQWQQTRDHTEARAFWQQRMRGFVSSQAIPSLATVSDQNDHHRAILHRKLDRKISLRLREGARRLGVSLNNLVQATWGLLLGAYTGTTDVTFGVARAGRYWPGGDPARAVGMFLHTLPFRLDTTCQQPLATWLSEIRTEQRTARLGEHVDLAMIRSWCRLPPGTLLFQTILMYEDDDADERFAELGLTTALYEQAESVILSAVAGTEINLSIEYPVADHNPAQIQRLLRQCSSLLLAMVETSPDSNLGELLTCLREEEAPLRQTWHGRALTSTPSSTISVLRHQAKQTPHSPAIESPNGASWTYCQLHHAAGQISHKLENQTTVQARVVVLLEASALQVMTWLACLQSRRIYAPIDPGNPPQRILRYIEDIQPALIITRSAYRSAIPNDWQVLCLDEQKLEGKETNIESASHPDDIAALLFTSGSTGHPKGVLLTHRGLDLCAQNFREHFPLPNSGRLLQLSAPSFDASIMEMLVTLQTGGNLVMANAEEICPGPALSQTLHERRIEIFWPTPSLLRQTPVVSNDLLKTIVSIGEPLTAELLGHWRGAWRFFNAYGPTECAIWATGEECRDTVTRPLIGRLLPGYRGYVLDDAGRPVPIGAIGELYLGGAGVAAGYWNRPDETAFRFLPDPFAANPQARMYRTGDLVRWWDDGRLEYLGRSDHQVKFHGIRLELGELEATLRQHPEVRDAVVELDADRLIAWVVGSSHEINPPKLRAWMADRVPLSLLPSSIAVLSAFPRTISGKVDRRQLPRQAHIEDASLVETRIDWEFGINRPEPRDEEPIDPTVNELFALQVHRDPFGVAVQDGNRKVTYAEIDRMARQVATRLRQTNLPQEGAVALKLRRSPEFIAAALGVMMAGGSYLPLDAEWPPLRQLDVLEDSLATVVLTDSHPAPLPNNDGPLWISVEDLWTAETLASDLIEPEIPPPERRAYLIYTSGSTGKPKGVEVEHRSLANLVQFYHRQLALTPEDRVTMLANVAFDASAADVWPALCCGARVLVPDQEVLTDPNGLIAWISESGATFSFVPTGLGVLLFGQPWPANLALRNLAVGGDTLHIRPPPGLPFVVWNTYGPTENTVDSTWAIVEPGDRAGNPSIGTPIHRVRAYLLDQELRPVAVGAAGELFLGGPQVARGYFRRPELTAERFLSDPFTSKSGARMYRSGDLVRRLPDGSLEFLGRVDDQVQIRGKRVELGEIESVLCRHPRVREACCRPIQHQGLCTGVTAHLAVDQPTEDLSLELSRYLSAHVPAHMIPAAYSFSQELPRTSNGKIDRRSLDSDGQKSTNKRPVELSEDGLLYVLRRVWTESFSVQGLSTSEEDFRLAGGDSLATMKLLLAVEQATGQRIPISALLQAPTLRGLYDTVNAARKGQRSSWLALRRQGTRPPVFCLYTMDGDVGSYFDLAGLLGGDQPIFAVTSQALFDPRAIPRSIEAAATDILKQIRQIHPAGPFAVLGYSWAGFLAFEVGRQALKCDRTCPFIGLIGTFSPMTHYARVVYHLRALFFRLRCQWPWLNRLYPMRGAPKTHTRDADAPVSFSTEVVEQHIRLAIRYCPPRGQSIPLVLWRDQIDATASNWMRQSLFGERDWDFWASQTTQTEWLDERHHDVMKPPTVGKLADSLRTALESHFANQPSDL